MQKIVSQNPISFVPSKETGFCIPKEKTFGGFPNIPQPPNGGSVIACILQQTLFYPSTKTPCSFPPLGTTLHGVSQYQIFQSSHASFFLHNVFLLQTATHNLTVCCKLLHQRYSQIRRCRCKSLHQYHAQSRECVANCHTNAARKTESVLQTAASMLLTKPAMRCTLLHLSGSYVLHAARAVCCK